MNLTKSDYLLFLKHPAWLWLKKHDQAKLPLIDEAAQAIIDTGIKLEPYAEMLFPAGVHLGFSSPDEYHSLSRRTAQAIKEGHTVLFQARFDADNLTCLPDVVEFTSKASLNLYEIKSSTKVKPEHRYDLAFQKHVLELCGYTVQNVSVILVNNSYVRKGPINPQELLSITDITEEVEELRRATEIHSKNALATALSSKFPDLSPRFANHLSALPEWLKIYRALVDLPENSIYELILITPKQVAELEDMDIITMDNIPADYPLTEKQQRQVASLKEHTQSINTEAIREFLSTFSYPLYFLDFETCTDAIPPYDGTRPYQQIPCQYSLHILETPGGDLRHTEFIHRNSECPAEPLTNGLRRDIGDTGTVIVWNKSFETTRNRELAELLLDHAEFFHDVNSRVIDLMIPFSKGMYVDSRFIGSASIKKVLPVLVPELSYKALSIQDGLTAQRLWMKAVFEGDGASAEHGSLFHDLLTYCELDTLAMVKIYEKLQLISERAL